ncbi:uncharacterized protein TNCV_1165421 [Trichonephila clavipes]|nr:uncharacterized protein TNCV_1165421 [Trichonephila clavipes]
MRLQDRRYQVLNSIGDPSELRNNAHLRRGNVAPSIHHQSYKKAIAHVYMSQHSSRQYTLDAIALTHTLAITATSFVRLSSGSLAGESTRGLLATDHVILNHGQVTWTTPELAPPLLTTTPHQRDDVSALDRFNVHRCPTRRVFSGTGLEPVTKQATVRYLYHSATAAMKFKQKKVPQ